MSYLRIQQKTRNRNAPLVYSGPVTSYFDESDDAHAYRFINRIRGSVAMMIDNSSIHLGSRGKSKHADYPLAIAKLGGRDLLWAAMACTEPINCRLSQLDFFAYMEQSGIATYRFAPLTTPSAQLIEDERAVDGKIRDLIRTAAGDTQCDSIVLFGADGGFTNAVKEARRAGKQVFVIAWQGTLNPALAHAASAFIYLESLLPFIGRNVH